MKIPMCNSTRFYHDLIVYDDLNHSNNGSSHSDHDLSSPIMDGDFSEYMWMENEEQFDREVMAKLEEEELIEQCMEAMLEDEYQQNTVRVPNGDSNSTVTNNSSNNEVDVICENLDKVTMSSLRVDESTLNPLAAEFVPATTKTTTSKTDI